MSGSLFFDLSNNVIPQTTTSTSTTSTTDLSNNNPNVSIINLINRLRNQLPNMNVINNNNTNINSILASTLQQKNKYKNVLSDDGKSDIQFLKYDSSIYSEKMCPIMMVDFEENEEIAKLPCGHIFSKDAILQWLEDESNKCPVCRHELKSKEIKIENNIIRQPSIHPFGPRNRRASFHNFLENYYEAEENHMLEVAIERSLNDMNDTNNSSDDEEDIPLFDNIEESMPLLESDGDDIEF